jgi:hypothetical protein
MDVFLLIPRQNSIFPEIRLVDLTSMEANYRGLRKELHPPNNCGKVFLALKSRTFWEPHGY